jgi:hypothetical protein
VWGVAGAGVVGCYHPELAKLPKQKHAYKKAKQRGGYLPVPP